MNHIDISGLDKAEVLAALYNHAKPQGMGFLHFDPKKMTPEEARKILGQGDDHKRALDGLEAKGGKVFRPSLYFDYLKGRVMKVDLGGKSLDPRLYDRDNGPGAALKALEVLIKKRAETIQLVGRAIERRKGSKKIQVDVDELFDELKSQDLGGS